MIFFFLGGGGGVTLRLLLEDSEIKLVLHTYKFVGLKLTRMRNLICLISPNTNMSSTYDQDVVVL